MARSQETRERRRKARARNRKRIEATQKQFTERDQAAVVAALPDAPSIGALFVQTARSLPKREEKSIVAQAIQKIEVADVTSGFFPKPK